MAKIRQFPYTLDSPFVINLHCGGETARSPYAWHCIHEYTSDYQWLFVDGTPLPNPLDIALCRTAALTWVSLPATVRDCCPACSGQLIYFYQGPKLPRPNIYRGQSHEIIPPCIYWDYLRPDPPPGFEW